MDCVILCTVRWDQAVRSHRVTSSCTSSRHCMRRRNITFLSCLRLSLSLLGTLLSWKHSRGRSQLYGEREELVKRKRLRFHYVAVRASSLLSLPASLASRCSEAVAASLLFVYACLLAASCGLAAADSPATECMRTSLDAWHQWWWWWLVGRGGNCLPRFAGEI